MLLGRTGEQARIDALLLRARAGAGGPLVVRGIPGIGKTRLLAEAVAGAGGMRVLAVGGRETESDLPFAALGELLAPILDGLGELAAPQEAALRAALALAPAAPGDRYAVSAGTLALLAAAAAPEPLLLVADDAQWLDAPTRSVLGFVARRLGGLPIAMLVAERPEGSPLLPDPDVPVLALQPLDRANSASLLRTLEPDLAHVTRDLVLDAAGGIPLGVRELAAMLADDERTGRRTPGLPLRPGDAIRGAYERRVARLPPMAHLALVVVAAAEPPDPVVISRALRALGTPIGALEAGEADGLIAIEPARIAWSHPLARSVVYHEAAAADRRRAHAALASVTRDGIRAWHLAAAAVGEDEEAATALELAGGQAAERRGYAAASAAYERAAVLSAPGEARAGRLLAAASSAAAAGEAARATSLLDHALADTGDPLRRVAIEHQRCAVMMTTGSAIESGRRLVAAAEAIAAALPAHAAAMLADAALAITTDDCAAGLVVAERAHAMLPGDAPPEVLAPVLAALAWCQDLGGRRHEADVTHARVAGLRPMVDPLSPAATAITVVSANRLLLDDPSGARAALLGMVDALRSAGALGALPYPLALVVYSTTWTGDWDAVDAIASEACSLAEETGQAATHGWALAATARLDAARGAYGRAAAALERSLAIAEHHHISSVGVYARSAQAFLALTANDPLTALPILREARAMADRVQVREPMMLPFCGDLVEALVRSGLRQEALDALDWLDALASGSGRPWALGLVARNRGLLGIEPPDDAFRRALELHATMPFDRARTLLIEGEVLHRSRRRTDARRALHAAVDGFTALGATPWADRARAELRAAGGTVRVRTSDDTLTDAELRVARAVGRGLTNREVGAELFLSPRTVESHLEHIYRKLGLRSRAQLVAWIAEGRLDP